MFKKIPEEKIIDWITNDRLTEFGKYLVSGSVHGKPGIPLAELTRVEKIISKSLDPEKQYQLGKKLLQRSEYTARNLGVGLIENGWPKYKEIEKLIWAAADDDDWIVREFAAGTFSRLLQKDFDHFSKLYLKLVKTGTTNIKRAIALSVKYDSKSQEKTKWKTYLQLIEPLLHEEAEYIRKNLGPFAIGDGLLGRFPDETLKACEKWVQSSNENVRWNVAMIFTAASARKFKGPAVGILNRLQEDKVLSVARAAKKAIKALSK